MIHFSRWWNLDGLGGLYKGYMLKVELVNLWLAGSLTHRHTLSYTHTQRNHCSQRCIVAESQSVKSDMEN